MATNSIGNIMKNTLVVVADLGCFKAYKLDTDHLQRTPRLELVEHYDNPQAHAHLVDQVSDQSGRFPRGSPEGGSQSAGERHNYELELRKRFVRQLADKFNLVARGRDIEKCYVAASRAILHPLLNELDPRVREKVQKHVPADLTKVGKAELLSHF